MNIRKGVKALIDAEVYLFRAADLLQRRQPPQPPQPVPVGERPWEREAWLDAAGQCWFETVSLIPGHAVWVKTWPSWVEKFPQCYCRALPHDALPEPLPAGEVE